jgi:hypothetical protein
MKVAVVGAEGTGRTTLARAAHAVVGGTLLPSLRDAQLAESGYHTLFEWTAALGGWAPLVERQLEREADLGPDAVIDSAALDLYCLAERWGAGALSPERLEELRDAVVAAAANYDRIVLTPQRLVAGPGPGRFRNALHNRQLARQLNALLRDSGLATRAIAILDEDEAARVAMLRAALAG